MVRQALIKNTKTLVQVVTNVQNQQNGTKTDEILKFLGKPLHLIKKLYFVSTSKISILFC